MITACINTIQPCVYYFVHKFNLINSYINMVLAVAAGRFCGIMSTSKKDFPIELIQKLISFGCFDRCPCGLDRPSLVLLFYFFFSFIS